MNFLQNLKRQHCDLVDLVQEIAQSARSSTAFRDKEFSKTLSFLEGKLKIHLTMEDTHLYPFLLESEDQGVGSKVSEYQQEMVGLYDIFHAFVMKVRGSEKESHDEGALHEELDGIVERLQKRIAFEEKVIFPLLGDGDTK
jgi:iron-sulfur cluster repair protein YtfE (RIC family)